MSVCGRVALAALARAGVNIGRDKMSRLVRHCMWPVGAGLSRLAHGLAACATSFARDYVNNARHQWRRVRAHIRRDKSAWSVRSAARPRSSQGRLSDLFALRGAHCAAHRIPHTVCARAPRPSGPSRAQLVNKLTVCAASHLNQHLASAATRSGGATMSHPGATRTPLICADGGARYAACRLPPLPPTLRRCPRAARELPARRTVAALGLSRQRERRALVCARKQRGRRPTPIISCL